jgi:hypothetical protein
VALRARWDGGVRGLRGKQSGAEEKPEQEDFCEHASHVIASP